jgi:hypothetical protein
MAALVAGCAVLAHVNAAPVPPAPVPAYAVSHFEPVGPPDPRAVEPEVAPPLLGDPASKIATLEARMFQSRLHGPYAASVRDGLNEMVIETNLVARGIEGVSTNAPDRDALLGAIPSHLPALGLVSSTFGVRVSPFTGKRVRHNGLDIAVSPGEPVFATADGVVAYAGWRKSFGRIIVINHGYGIVTKYAHNSQLLYHEGDVVTRGDVIARAGSTGRSTGPHVHYEVWVNGRVIDPTQFMFDVPERDLGTAESLAMARIATGRQGVAGVGLASDVGAEEDDAAGMGGEVELSDAPEVGAAVSALPAPDRGRQAGVSGAILAIFAGAALLVVGLSRPRDMFL